MQTNTKSTQIEQAQKLLNFGFLNIKSLEGNYKI